MAVRRRRAVAAAADRRWPPWLPVSPDSWQQQTPRAAAAVFPETLSSSPQLIHQITTTSQHNKHTQDVTYGVFGLGNKQYEHFNAVGKRVERAMDALGAKALVRRGDGDDDECIDDDFDKWSAELLASLEAATSLVGAASAAPESAIPEVAPEYPVEIHSGAPPPLSLSLSLEAFVIL